MKKDLRERLGKEWLFCDGGTGTFLQERGLQGGELPETWNVDHPDIIQELYESYLKAGSDIFNTNTFGLNSFKFPGRVEELMTAAVEIAKKARINTGREDAYIAIDVGPTGKLLEPKADDARTAKQKAYVRETLTRALKEVEIAKREGRKLQTLEEFEKELKMEGIL